MISFKEISILLIYSGMIGCAHEVYTNSPNYSRIDGWLHGKIDSTGLGVYGSPAANRALSNGRDEVKNKICYGREVYFRPISPNTTVVHNISTTDIGYGNSYSSGSSRKVTIAKGYSFICGDADISTKTFLFDPENLTCKELDSFSPGEKRIVGVKNASDTQHCEQYKGWYRVFNANQNPIDLFFGKEGEETCNILIKEFVNSDAQESNRFLLKKLTKCKVQPNS